MREKVKGVFFRVVIHTAKSAYFCFTIKPNIKNKEVIP